MAIQTTMEGTRCRQTVLAILLTSLILAFMQRILLCSYAQDTKQNINGQPNQKFNIAVSLVLSDSSRLDALYTLFRSDITDHAAVDVFAFANSPGSTVTGLFLQGRGFPAAGHRTLLTVDDVVFNASTGWEDPRIICPGLKGSRNLGIVLPRIRIMQEVLKEEQAGSTQYDWLLEVHDDMLFPRSWFKELICHDKPDVAILMPMRLSQKFSNTSELEYACEQAKSDVVSSQAHPNHPWLLRLDAVRQVGYYDSWLSPWEFEDTEFYYFVCALTPWKCIVVGQSVVVHPGSGTWAKKGACNKLVDPSSYLKERLGQDCYDYYNCVARFPSVVGRPLIDQGTAAKCAAYQDSFRRVVANATQFVKSAPGNTWWMWRYRNCKGTCLHPC